MVSLGKTEKGGEERDREQNPSKKQIPDGNVCLKSSRNWYEIA